MVVGSNPTRSIFTIKSYYHRKAAYVLLNFSSLCIDTIRHQEQLAKMVTTADTPGLEIKRVCGVDVSYKNNMAYCSASVIDKDSLNVIDSVNTRGIVYHPYIPGLFTLREYEPIMNTLKLLNTEFQVLFIDGHGRLHPRRCGLASHIGVMIDRPTVGIAKSLICGFVREDQFIEFDGEILGFQIGTDRKRQIYVSIGHRISLGSAIKVTKELTKSHQWLPEPLRVAHVNSKNQANFV